MSGTIDKKVEPISSVEVVDKPRGIIDSLRNHRTGCPDTGYPVGLWIESDSTGLNLMVHGEKLRELSSSDLYWYIIKGINIYTD